MCSSRQIERHIKEVNDCFVNFDGDFKLHAKPQTMITTSQVTDNF